MAPKVLCSTFQIPDCRPAVIARQHTTANDLPASTYTNAAVCNPLVLPSPSLPPPPPSPIIQFSAGTSTRSQNDREWLIGLDILQFCISSPSTITSAMLALPIISCIRPSCAPLSCASLSCIQTPCEDLSFRPWSFPALRYVLTTPPTSFPQSFVHSTSLPPSIAYLSVLDMLSDRRGKR